MEIKDILKKRNLLESKILSLVSEDINRFREETGISAKHINIEMKNVTSYGDEHPQYILWKVVVELAIE